MEGDAIRGRGAAENPTGRFERLAYEPDAEAELWPDEDGEPRPRTEYYRDHSRSILTHNDSPDVGFTHSVNPYRGCEPGCSYCFARPTHEWLGLSAGLDFETKIFVKETAPELLRRALSSPSWAGEPVAMSGITDPYQPVERRLRITRGCLEVLAECGNPVGIVTKGHLVTRDADLLGRLASHGAAVVHLSITSLDPALQRVMEPRASTPARRLEAISELAAAGVPVGVLVAPVIPGLTDHELPAILEAAAAAGASTAGFVPLRLPYGLPELFEAWLERHFPDRKEKVLHRIREIRGGALNDPHFGSRMRGQGEYAEQIRALFHVTCRRLGLNRERLRLSSARFVRPAPPPRKRPDTGQLEIFG
jgi:DNA repair photolyase